LISSGKLRFFLLTTVQMSMVQSGANSSDGIGLLNLLLAKSGANMLNALTRFIQSIEALERIAVNLANWQLDLLWAMVFG
jgi:hypothetical protein